MENLEKKIKDKLQHNKIDIDTNELWADVYPHIKPKRNRRAILFLSIGLLWLFSLVAVGYYFNGDSDQHKEVVDLTIQKLPETKKGKEQSIVEEGLGVNSQKPITSGDISADVPEVLSPVIERQKERINDIHENEEIINSATTIENYSTRGNNIIINDIDVIADRELIVSHSTDSTDSNDSGQVKQLKDTKNTSTNFPETKKSNKTESAIANRTNLIDGQVAKSIVDLSMVYLDNSISLLNYNFSQPIIPNEFYADYRSHHDYSKFSIYALGSISKISRSLTLRDNLGSTDLDRRSMSESPLESLTGEIGLHYELMPNLLLSAGVNTVRINEKIKDSYSVTETVLLENVIIENIISSRGTEPVYGNIEAERTVITDLTAFNRYNDLALSVDLTYLLRTEGLKPYISAGLQQSLVSSQTGYWIINDNDLYDLSEDPDAFLSKSYGLGFRFGAGLDLEVSDRLSLRLGGRFTKYLNPITTKAYSLKQRYDLLGLTAGLNIKL